MCEVTTLCFHAQTDRQSRICSCRSTRTCSCPWPFWYKTFFSDFPRTRHGDRSDSWDAFLCHGSFETFDGIIPRSILAVYPEEVANDKIIPYKNSGRRSVPDITRARTAITAPIALTSTPTLSTIIGWSPTSSATSGPSDSALRSAFNVQLSSRGRYPPVQFRSEEGGTTRQINRRDAARIIMHTMGDFRRREVRKWRFGTHFTEYLDYENWDQSIDAFRVRSEYRRSQEVARMNDVPRARSPRTTRRDERARNHHRHLGLTGR